MGDATKNASREESTSDSARHPIYEQKQVARVPNIWLYWRCLSMELRSTFKDQGYPFLPTRARVKEIQVIYIAQQNNQSQNSVSSFREDHNLWAHHELPINPAVSEHEG